MQLRALIISLVASAEILLAAPAATQESKAEDHSNWSHYGGGQHGMQYSGLDQVTAENVANLVPAWTFRTGELSRNFRGRLSFQANPILAEGKLYVPTGSAIVFAIDPSTGEQIWKFDPRIDRNEGYSESANRGVTSWIDPQAKAGALCRHTIFSPSLHGRVMALDGATGAPCLNFADKGMFDLHQRVRGRPNDPGDYLVTSPPVVVNDVLVVGSAIGDNGAVELELGIVRGIDARSGEEIWRFDPLPRAPDDPMHATWQPDQVARTGAANAWAPLAADTERGIVYVPTGSASPDFYGGERLGDNRYANSLVALDAATGDVIWHQQLVHHDLWDYDLASQPTLVDLERDGETIPAVIQGTKMGLVFTFNRMTGEPIFAVEERAVPQTDVPGEVTSPTQPFPIAPPPLVPHGPVKEDDLWGMLLFDEWSCEDKYGHMRSEGIYTPPSLEGSIMTPGYAGGINWGGVAFDPVRQIAVANAMNVPMMVQLLPRDVFNAERRSGKNPNSQYTAQSGTPYGMRREPLISSLEAPCAEPPWGTLSAVDMRAGTILWQIPLGNTEDLAPIAFDWGVPNMGGAMMTAPGLIFIAATTDSYFRAFDINSGDVLWEYKLPAGGQATPMTYMDPKTGKQFIVLAAGGHSGLGTPNGDYVLAFALP